MTNSFFDRIYENRIIHTPDVLSCLSNLSNDEVFTPPEIANKMLDLLPEEIFSDPEATFLDPACKSGVFLREIAKRLLEGLKYKIPNLEQRIDHIFNKQIFGVAITELTSLLSRRSVYCSKYPNGKYSVCNFSSAEGNIRFRKTYHTWANGKCRFCGASQAEYDRGGEKESYAYEFIHTLNAEELFNMKFDVIISNPPYQLQINEAGKGLGAIPIYHKFVYQSMKLNPRFLIMIIPARWYSGGVGLDKFREDMLYDKRIKKLVDYTNSSDCFPGVDVNGGICYFLWDKLYTGKCDYTNITSGNVTKNERDLNEFDIFLRRNEAVSIIHKVLENCNRFLSDIGGCSPQTPYGILSTYTGTKEPKKENDCKLLTSKGWVYISRSEIRKNVDTIDLYKPMVSKLTCEHAGNPDKNGMFRILSRMEILKPNEICNQSYLTVCAFEKRNYAENCFNYLRTKFVRFLILQTLAGMNLSIANFKYVPWLDFSKPWTDEELYKKYNLTEEEINFIESMIRPME